MDCERCEGTGTIEDDDGYDMTCLECDGTGIDRGSAEFDDSENLGNCPSCEGHGFHEVPAMDGGSHGGTAMETYDCLTCKGTGSVKPGE